MMQVERATAIPLPDGSFVRIETYEDAVKAHEDDPRRWKSLDVSLVHPDGKDETLCSVDFEDQKGLRVLVFAPKVSDPIFERYVGYGPEQGSAQ